MNTLADDKLCELSGTPDRAILSQGCICSKCGISKPEDQFTGWPRNKWCKACAKAYQVAFRAAHKQKTGSADYRGTGRNKYHAAQSGVYKKLHILLKDRVHRKGGDCDTEYLEALWIAQGGLCALSRQPMNLDGGENVVSIDQIVAGDAYTRGNVQLVRWCVNRAKGAMATEDFLRMCADVARCNDYPVRE